MTREWEDAVQRCSVDELQHQLANGGDINAKDRRGQTAVMIAARDGHPNLIAWLVERGAALDGTGKYGLSPLMVAVVRGHTEVVRRLVAAGADTTLRGTGAPGFAHKTALDLATERGDAAMIEILKK